MVTPAQAQKRKHALKVWVDEYNLKHPKHPIVVPAGFKWEVGIVGIFARELIREVQKVEWPNLPTTGEFDSRMLNLLFPPKPVGYGVLGLKTAHTQVGVHENPAGSNHGLPFPTGYEEILGLDHQPWCACFVTWCLRKNGWTEKGWNQAYCPAWASTAHAHTHGLITVSASMLLPGDIVTFDWDNDGIQDHIGFVDSDVVNGSFHTVEGNTSSTSNSNGGAVEARVRNVSDVGCMIRILATKV